MTLICLDGSEKEEEACGRERKEEEEECGREGGVLMVADYHSLSQCAVLLVATIHSFIRNAWLS